MNKAHFIDLVKSCGNYKTKAEAETAVKALTEAIASALTKKEDISLVGFGSFSVALQKGKSAIIIKSFLN